MSSYIIGLGAAVIAASLTVMLTSGTRLEKICSSVALCAIVLFALAPIASFSISETAEEVKRSVEIISDNTGKIVESEYRREIERRLIAAAAGKYSITECEIETETNDGAVYVTHAVIRSPDEDTERLKNYVSGLLGTDNIEIVKD